MKGTQRPVEDAPQYWTGVKRGTTAGTNAAVQRLRDSSGEIMKPGEGTMAEVSSPSTSNPREQAE